MKRKILVLIIVSAVLFPTLALGVEFPNPAGDFLIDLTRPGIGRSNTFASLLAYLIQLVLGLVGLLAMAFIILGGFQYITARGDEERSSAGKKTLTNAIIGLVIVILSYTMIAVVINALFGRISGT
jgi:hypothetical protein